MISFSHLFELQFRVDPHIADLTVEGSFLSVGVHWPTSLLSNRLGTQARICLDWAQPAPCLQNSFMFGTCKKTYTQDDMLVRPLSYFESTNLVVYRLERRKKNKTKKRQISLYNIFLMLLSSEQYFSATQNP